MNIAQASSGVALKPGGALQALLGTINLLLYHLGLGPIAGAFRVVRAIFIRHSIPRLADSSLDFRPYAEIAFNHEHETGTHVHICSIMPKALLGSVHTEISLDHLQDGQAFPLPLPRELLLAKKRDMGLRVLVALVLGQPLPKHLELVLRSIRMFCMCVYIHVNTLCTWL